MGQVFYKLYYHVIWRTKENNPIITPRIEEVVFPFLENKAKRYRSFIHAVNGTENHLHVAITIPPSFAVSDIVGKLKGSTSYFLNMELGITKGFSWQDGFGVFSFSERDLPGIKEYIRNQKEHHKSGKLREVLERTDSDEVIGSRFSER
ncbi:MAG: IS200/IS605 family transposase [Bacteroidota bacterium]